MNANAIPWHPPQGDEPLQAAHTQPLADVDSTKAPRATGSTSHCPYRSSAALLRLEEQHQQSPQSPKVAHPPYRSAQSRSTVPSPPNSTPPPYSETLAQGWPVVAADQASDHGKASFFPTQQGTGAAVADISLSDLLARSHHCLSAEERASPSSNPSAGVSQSPRATWPGGTSKDSSNSSSVGNNMSVELASPAENSLAGNSRGSGTQELGQRPSWYESSVPQPHSATTAAGQMVANDPYSFVCVSRSPRSNLIDDGAPMSYAAALVGKTASAARAAPEPAATLIPLPRSRRHRAGATAAAGSPQVSAATTLAGVYHSDVAAAIAKKVTQAALLSHQNHHHHQHQQMAPKDLARQTSSHSFLPPPPPSTQTAAGALTSSPAMLKPSRAAGPAGEVEPMARRASAAPEAAAVTSKSTCKQQQHPPREKPARKGGEGGWVIVGGNKKNQTRGSGGGRSASASATPAASAVAPRTKPVKESIGQASQFDILTTPMDRKKKRADTRGKDTGAAATVLDGRVQGHGRGAASRDGSPLRVGSSESGTDSDVEAPYSSALPTSAGKQKRKARAHNARDVRQADEELLAQLVDSVENTEEAEDLVAKPVQQSPYLCLMGMPVRCLASVDSLIEAVQGEPRVPAKARSLATVLQRSLSFGDNTSAKTVLMQRALAQLTPAVTNQFPSLACAVLLEASDCFVDFEQSVQCAQHALQLSSEAHQLPAFEMLSRLAITRIMARVINTSGAIEHLVRAAQLALSLGEREVLGHVTLQIGITLELSGNFADALQWYSAAEQVARTTEQTRLLCDVLCCKAIANYAVGEMGPSEEAHRQSRVLFESFPPAWRQRPLQNFVQLMLQTGNMESALRLHSEELEVARAQGDSATVSRCMGSMALALRYLGRHEEAAAAYMHELATYHSPDARQVVESLTGAVPCFLLSGHEQKAFDYALRAVRQAALSNEQCTIAKALVELAEVLVHRWELPLARKHVIDALDAMSTVDPVDRKQYLVKATLCELEWRCCSLLQRIAFHATPEPRMLDALVYSDLCNVPNTAGAHALLQRRQRQYASTKADPKPSSVEPGSYLTKNLVSDAALAEMLSDELFRGRKLVCYSLPWTEESTCMAFVLSATALDPSSSYEVAEPSLQVRGYTLELSNEVLSLLVKPSALNGVFDADMWTLDEPERRRVYGDTPLWPQHYSVIAFQHEASTRGCGGAPSKVTSDPLYCLQLLYDSFVRPLEAELHVCDDGGAAALRGVTFVADGIFTRVPFHALHDGTGFLTERLSITSCCSLSLLCMLYASAKKQRASAAAGPAKGYLVDVQASAADREKSVVISVAGLDVVHTVVDDVTGGAIKDSHSSLTEESEDVDCARVRSLLRSLQCQRRDKASSNRLYSAVHEHAGACGPAVVELNLPVVPEVREDFCGYCVASQSDMRVCHSLDIAYLWDLHRTALVVCGEFGTYSGFSIHETGVPLYRSLQYAGASRLLLPIGTMQPSDKRVAVAAVEAAMAVGAEGEEARSVADAVKEARCRLIQSGAPLESWTTYTLCGIP